MDKSKFGPMMDFYRKKHRMPSYAEIARLMGFKSKNSAYKMVRGMIKSGLVDKDETGRILPKKDLFSIPVLGTVEAGFPSPAEEELVDTMTMDDYLIENREATYLLKVQGDSMVDAGIMPGDMVLVERRSDARDGDVVIAEVDHEWTMKYFRKRGSKVYLIPANAKYSPIEAEDELKIAAIVKAVVRKY
jgi:SOS regulatory protein LexA